MKLTKIEIEEQGKAGERAFTSWLNDNGFAFIACKQNKQSMASVFKKAVKRPDFFVLIPNMGFIAIDVKHYTPNESDFTLGIEKELAPAMEYERLFRQYLWYAYKDAQSDSKEWYFISAYDAIEHGVQKTNSITSEQYLSISKKSFSLVKEGKDIHKLFKHRVGSMGTLARLVEGYFTKGKI